jgi:ribonuclease HII
MKRPNFQEEKKLWKKGFKRVACLDEAGRGPIAGPVTAAAVIFCPANLKIKNEKLKILRRIKDSKKLSSKKREEFYKILTTHPGIWWGIGTVSEKMIDKFNILGATKLAMKKALAKLKHRPDFLILDGRMKINSPARQKSIVKADEKVFSCACASILAKVTRDRLMLKYHQKYPRYKFNLHKGYPTKLHCKLLKRYGPSVIHRTTFTPVARMLKYIKKYKVVS